MSEIAVPGYSEVVIRELVAVEDVSTGVEYLNRTKGIAVLTQEFYESTSLNAWEATRALVHTMIRIAELVGEPSQAPLNELSLSVPDHHDRADIYLFGKYRNVAFAEVDEWRKETRWTLNLVRSAIKRWRREHEPSDYTEGERQDDIDGPLTLRHGDFRTRLADVPDGSVDLILTDPPYPKDDLHLYGEVAAFAARKLGPRGRLAVYAGNIFVPQVLELVGQHLAYGWTYCLLMDNPGQSRIFGRHIIQTWKPVFVFTTGTWPSGEWHQDLLYSDGPEKDDYPWQQAEHPAFMLVERLSPPDGIVLDPFMGVGTFGRAARRAGRRFIGCELNQKRYQTAVERLA